MPDITYDVGRVSFVMRGAWNLATSYEKLDAVSYNGSLYIAKQDVPGGTAITNTTYWQLAAEKGDQGETGNGIASIAKTGTAGNVDTYTITYTDGTTTTFTVTNGGVTTVNGRTGDVTGLAEEAGSYPLLNAGTADNLTPYSEDSGATQSIPFIAQGTGCGNGASVVDTGSYLQFKKKLGNTVGVNQQVKHPHFDATTDWTNLDSVSGGVGTSVSLGKYASIRQDVSPVVGHKYYISATATADSTRNLRLCFFNGGTAKEGITFEVTQGVYKRVEGIVTLTEEANRFALANWSDGNAVVSAKEIIYIDLTLWYGSNDRIPPDLLSHPENWGRYYAGSLDYAAGYLDSADGTVLTSIHRNIWEEQTELGRLDTSTGANASASNQLRTQGYLKVIPATAYYLKCPSYIWVLFYDDAKNVISSGLPAGNYAYSNNARGIGGTNKDPTFTTPPNCSFIRFYMQAGYGTTYNHDITISLYYPGESGYNQYYPYSVLAEVDTGSEPLYGDGTPEHSDVKLPNGEITRKRPFIDLGTLNWGATSTYGNVHRAQVAVSNAVNSNRSTNFLAPMRCVNYTPSLNVVDAAAMATAGLIGIAYNNIFVTFAASKTAAEVKSALNGEMFLYEYVTPTTEQGTAFAENIPCDDFGSMYWTQTKGIPQGNEIFYPVDYKASIDTLYNRVEGDMSKIVTEDEYPEAPSSDGTYVLKATVSGGTKTYAWVAE